MTIRHGVGWRDLTDEWKKIVTLKEAIQIAREAREAKDAAAVTKAKAKAKKTEAKSKFEPPQKSFAGGENFLVTGGESPRCGMVIKLQGQVNSNGAGSTGKSSPDAAAPATPSGPSPPISQ